MQQMMSTMGNVDPGLLQQQMRMMQNMSPADMERAQQQMSSMDPNTLARQAEQAKNMMSAQQKYVLDVSALEYRGCTFICMQAHSCADNCHKGTWPDSPSTQTQCVAAGWLQLVCVSSLGFLAFAAGKQHAQGGWQQAAFTRCAS